MFTVLAKKVEAKDQNACEKVCSTQQECQSFTWIVGESRACWWSIDKLHYHNDFMYAAKVETPPEDEPDKKWNEMPGLRWTTSVAKTDNKLTFEQCKEQCMEDGVSCKCVTYKQSTMTCAKSSEALPQNKDAKYFEKRTDTSLQDEEVAIKAAEATLKTKFQMQQSKALASAEAETQELAESTAKMAASKEIYAKQVPSKTEEVKIKQKVESQVNAANARIHKEESAEMEKQQLKRRAAIETQKAATLEKFHAVQKKQEKYDRKKKQAKRNLKRMASKVKRAEHHASAKANDLETQLTTVKAAHEAALVALQAFKDSRNTTNQEAKDAASAAIQETHIKLKAAVHEAEFSHLSEVKSKKFLKDLVAREKKDGITWEKVQADSAEQRLKDAKFLKSTKEKTHKDAVYMAKGVVASHQATFDVVMAKETEYKKKLASCAAAEAVAKEVEEKAKHEEKAGAHKKYKAAQDATEQKQNEMKEFESKVKASYVTLQASKVKLEHLNSDDGVVKTQKADEDSQIDAASKALEQQAAFGP